MTKSIGYRKAALLVVLTAFSNVFANDLGVLGKTYDIAERDYVEVIFERLNEKKASGELDKLNQKMLDDAKAYARRPTGLNLPRAIEYRAVELSPVYTLDRDITDAQGKILFKKGTTVNPLDIRPLTKTLCFFDGDDQEQIAWVDKYCAGDIRNKLILTNGDVFNVAEQLDKRVYFDQRGVMVSMAGIKALPAVIRQSGQVLYVEEFPIQ